MAQLSSGHTQHHEPTEDLKLITLIKGADRWRFRWVPGQEHHLIDALADMAGDATYPLDWFDAAVVSHQITNQLEIGGPELSDSSTTPW